MHSKQKNIYLPIFTRFFLDKRFWHMASRLGSPMTLGAYPLTLPWSVRIFAWRRQPAYSLLRLSSSKCCDKRWKCTILCDSKESHPHASHAWNETVSFAASDILILVQQYLHEFQPGPHRQERRVPGVLRRRKWVHQALSCVVPMICYTAFMPGERSAGARLPRLHYTFCTNLKYL
jgi:hypothetical protein